MRSVRILSDSCIDDAQQYIVDVTRNGNNLNI